MLCLKWRPNSDTSFLLFINSVKKDPKALFSSKGWVVLCHIILWKCIINYHFLSRYLHSFCLQFLQWYFCSVIEFFKHMNKFRKLLLVTVISSMSSFSMSYLPSQLGIISPILWVVSWAVPRLCITTVYDP